MKHKIAAFIVVGCLTSQAWANTIDLSGAVSGTLITAADGSSFAESFAGQTVSGTALVGSPSSPLTLQAAGTLGVEFFNSFNTILPQSGNQGPLALLLSQQADAISWQMGYADGGDPVTINFYDANGNTVHTVIQTLNAGYDTYSFSGFGAFAGLAISDDNDGGGLRYYDFQFDPASQTSVPDAGATASMLLVAILPLLMLNRRFRFAKL